MTIESLRSLMPTYAKDVKLNLGKLFASDLVDGLEQNQVFSIALASAYATKNAQIITTFIAEATDKISEEELNAAKAAASIMAMNNIYYRFVHLASDPEYGQMPANLRMNIMANPGIDKADFELMSLAVSAINGCGMCIDAHIKEVEKSDISKAGIQSAIRIASVVNSAAQVLAIEEIEAGKSLQAA